MRDISIFAMQIYEVFTTPTRKMRLFYVVKHKNVLFAVFCHPFLLKISFMIAYQHIKSLL